MILDEEPALKPTRAQPAPDNKPPQAIEILSDEDFEGSLHPPKTKLVPSVPSSLPTPPGGLQYTNTQPMHKRPAVQEDSNVVGKRARIEVYERPLLQKDAIKSSSRMKTEEALPANEYTGTSVQPTGSLSDKRVATPSALKSESEVDFARDVRPPSLKRQPFTGPTPFRPSDLLPYRPARTPLFLPSASPTPGPSSFPSKVARNAKSRTPLFLPSISPSPVPIRHSQVNGSFGLRTSKISADWEFGEDEAEAEGDQRPDHGERHSRFTDSQGPQDLRTAFGRMNLKKNHLTIEEGTSERRLLNRIRQLQGEPGRAESIAGSSHGRVARDDMDELYATETEEGQIQTGITKPGSSREGGSAQKPSFAPTPASNPIIPLLISGHQARDNVYLGRGSEAGKRRATKTKAQKTKKRKRGLRFCVLGVTETDNLGRTTVHYRPFNGSQQ
ncbi:hypothetical protein OE88DRAFT_1807534 [Heliocybe sulcata]|uniref:Uncharacterized protein n=1 Tax=Heliocybe sulcata TaxID=5364 RepID=A0A5C3N645_9AGAM|nr:hypothetical protein OE88DRAFT_1807534 [Heliocybe sulcata]